METEKAASTSRLGLFMRSIRTGIFGTLFVSKVKKSGEDDFRKK